ncbi:DUF4352 domain-containing protein [Oceanobacillus sp. FSL K6-2867]|uniref:DUF4352 domain-containing protein n=1 Tax=Oceanobacillus sp. FSL K6-2867 TaxID=2954748 RepID=UPI0030DBC594
MKKMLQILAVLFISTLLLGACSSDDSEPSEEIDNGTTEANDDETNESAETEEDNTEEKNTEEDTDNDSNSGGFNTGTEDQEDLSIGDTGKFDSDLTTYEITLDEAQVLDELDGNTSQLDAYILLDITVKNTGDDAQSVQDLLYGLEVTDNLEMTGYQNYAESFDSVEEMTGELAPGEEVSGQFVTEIYEGENYYFRLRTGIAGSGSSNQVTWVIPAEEAE